MPTAKPMRVHRLPPPAAHPGRRGGAWPGWPVGYGRSGTGRPSASNRIWRWRPVTFELSPLCDQTAAEAAKELADLSDPLLDTLAQRHTERERPLFVS